MVKLPKQFRGPAEAGERWMSFGYATPAEHLGDRGFEELKRVFNKTAKKEREFRLALEQQSTADMLRQFIGAVLKNTQVSNEEQQKVAWARFYRQQPDTRLPLQRIIIEPYARNIFSQRDAHPPIETPGPHPHITVIPGIQKGQRYTVAAVRRVYNDSAERIVSAGNLAEEFAIIDGETEESIHQNSGALELCQQFRTKLHTQFLGFRVPLQEEHIGEVHSKIWEAQTRIAPLVTLHIPDARNN
ncbi:hypothetical protein COV82_05940 [Candidatus Peregrinibacteria bacterium CG11_big_fil_rev_8_21_14_0_20_46_8]|nr:MAG: hypothetical protein COV82_05940 [Candidatus Peregrinibacteria bacterium CG11_big_fil_rev_8_21_14_0_20_46_8]